MFDGVVVVVVVAVVVVVVVVVVVFVAVVVALRIFEMEVNRNYVFSFRWGHHREINLFSVQHTEENYDKTKEVKNQEVFLSVYLMSTSIGRTR